MSKATSWRCSPAQALYWPPYRLCSSSSADATSTRGHSSETIGTCLPTSDFGCIDWPRGPLSKSSTTKKCWSTSEQQTTWLFADRPDGERQVWNPCSLQTRPQTESPPLLRTRATRCRAKKYRAIRKRQCAPLKRPAQEFRSPRCAHLGESRRFRQGAGEFDRKGRRERTPVPP